MSDEFAGAERRVYMPGPVGLAAHRSKARHDKPDHLMYRWMNNNPETIHWKTQQRIMLSEDAPMGVRLDASEKRLDRLVGKSAQRIDGSVDVSIGRQMIGRYATTRERREALRKLWTEVLAASEEKPTIDVTETEDDG